MAVFTELTPEEARGVLAQFRVGSLRSLQGISSGIENSNFFLGTDTGDYVLTVFERLSADQLPFYLGLMRHLAQRGLPVPEPHPAFDGSLFAEVRGKPVAIVARVPGRSVIDPSPEQCALVGEFLARMHLEGSDFPDFQPNLRGLGWWKDAVSALDGHVAPALMQSLLEELIFQDSVARLPDYESLPSGPIHADLFRDNVLFEADRIGGVIDFYFAACGPWLFDLAVTVNDWCVDLDTGAFRRRHVAALMQAYHSVRPLRETEHRFWRAMLRAAAMRFWVSRLYDLHLPRPASMLTPHDPTRFERLLKLRISEAGLPWL